jgi:hypothetical protein
MLPCFSKVYFGVECPGCGTQRAIVCLLRGEFWDSIALFPALIPLAIFLSLSLCYLIRPTQSLFRLVLVSTIGSFSIIIVHYILKIAGLAPWYVEAASRFQHNL